MNRTIEVQEKCSFESWKQKIYFYFMQNSGPSIFGDNFGIKAPWIHAVPSYKERLVDHRNFKERKLVNLEKLKNIFQNPTIQTFWLKERYHSFWEYIFYVTNLYISFKQGLSKSCTNRYKYLPQIGQGGRKFPD